jgi:hypothetical protein
MHVRRCRDCGEEYRPEVALCADCGGLLEDADDEGVPFGARPRPDREAAAEPAPAPIPDGYLTVYVGRDLREIHSLADCLGEHEIPFHLEHDAGERGQAPSTFSLLVPEPEAPRARRAIAPLLPHGADPEAVDRAFHPETGYGECPACTAPIPPGAPACPDCGLAMASEEEP